MKPTKKIKKMLFDDARLLSTVKEEKAMLGLAARTHCLVDVLNVLHGTNKSFEYWLKEAIYESRSSN